MHLGTQGLEIFQTLRRIRFLLKLNPFYENPREFVQPKFTQHIFQLDHILNILGYGKAMVTKRPNLRLVNIASIILKQIKLGFKLIGAVIGHEESGVYTHFNESNYEQSIPNRELVGAARFSCTIFDLQR